MLKFFDEIRNHINDLHRPAQGNQQALALYGVLQDFERSNRGHRHLLNHLATPTSRETYPAHTRTFDRSLSLLLSKLVSMVDEPVRWAPEVEAVFRTTLPYNVQLELAQSVRRHLTNWAITQLKDECPRITWDVSYDGYAGSTREDKSISIVFKVVTSRGNITIGKPVHAYVVVNPTLADVARNLIDTKFAMARCLTRILAGVPGTASAPRNAVTSELTELHDEVHDAAYTELVQRLSDFAATLPEHDRELLCTELLRPEVAQAITRN